MIRGTDRRRDDSDLPEIMINGEMKKVTKREAHKWNDTGTGQHDDATFAKLDAEVCAYSMIESTSVH